jgi:two-component system OmpR family response regulator
VVTVPKTGASILIVDGDSRVCEELAAVLSSRGLSIHTASAPTGTAALTLALNLRPDVVVLEVDLPNMDGFEVLRRLRAEYFDGAVVFLAARGAVADKVEGLTLGAADYIAKPYDLAEVAMRLQAILRRARRDADAPRVVRRWAVADLELDAATHQVWKAGVVVALSPTEFRLLHHFMDHPCEVLSYANIIDHVWDADDSLDVNVVRTYVKYLRRKLESGNSRLLHTVRGVGYALRPPR